MTETYECEEKTTSENRSKNWIKIKNRGSANDYNQSCCIALGSIWVSASSFSKMRLPGPAPAITHFYGLYFYDSFSFLSCTTTIVTSRGNAFITRFIIFKPGLNSDSNYSYRISKLTLLHGYVKRFMLSLCPASLSQPQVACREHLDQGSRLNLSQ